MKTKEVRDDKAVRSLIEWADTCGVRVLRDRIGGEGARGGGLCRLKGCWTILVDKKAPVGDQAALILESMSSLVVDGHLSDVDEMRIAEELRPMWRLTLDRRREAAADAEHGLSAEAA